MWIVSLAAVLIAASIVAVVLLANPLSRPHAVVRAAAADTSQPNPPSVTASPSSVPSTDPNVPPVAAPAAPVVTLESFGCGSSVLTDGKAPLVAAVDALRTGRHSGYDRLVVQFNGAQPGTIELRPQEGNSFTRSPRGDTVSLAGSDGILIRLRGADAHTAYSGPLDITTGHNGLAEVRLLEDFEGQVQFGLGVTGPACYNASIYQNPTRLVVDVQTS